jgi:zinc protease
MRRSLCLLIAAIAGVLIASRAEAVDIREVTTPRGIKAWLVQDKSAPLVALSFSFPGGTASEPESQRASPVSWRAC